MIGRTGRNDELRFDYVTGTDLGSAVRAFGITRRSNHYGLQSETEGLVMEAIGAVQLAKLGISATKYLAAKSSLSRAATTVDEVAEAGAKAMNASKEEVCEKSAANRGIWDQGPGIRGEAIEKQLGQNLPKTYPKLDRFKDGHGVSIKSMDVGAKSYASPAAILSRGRQYVDDVADFVLEHGEV